MKRLTARDDDKIRKCEKSPRILRSNNAFIFTHTGTSGEIRIMRKNELGSQSMIPLSRVNGSWHLSQHTYTNINLLIVTISGTEDLSRLEGFQITKSDAFVLMLLMRTY